MRAPLLVWVLAGVALWRAGGHAESGQLFKAGADAVAVDVLVSRDGRPVPGLGSADFVLLDNGVPQRVVAVAVEDVPITLVLALDASASVAGARLVELKQAAAAAVATLRPADRFGLLTFSQRVRMRIPPPAAPRAIAAELEAVEADGDTALYDATLAALAVGREARGRTVLLVFSDGTDTASWLDPRDVLDAARKSDLAVFAVTAPRNESQGRLLFGSESLQREWFPKEPGLFPGGFLPLLVQDTGGALFAANDQQRLRDAFVRVVDEYRRRYVLTYTPSGVAASGWHDLTVRLQKGRGDVRARRGYQR